jgi:glycosyltransferase involved in cell wall biosynthesis
VADDFFHRDERASHHLSRQPMRFSIITPSFRNSEWLRLCVASVADQHVEHEHIIQDARSDDGTLDWLLNDSRVKAHVESDSGMYDAINRGLGKATGDIIAYLNCDEQYLPGALASVEAFFAQHPDVEVVFADAVAVDREGEYLWHRKMLRPLLWHTWTCPLSVLTCATFFRRSVIAERKIFFSPRWRYVGDSAWVLELIRQRVPTAVLRRFTSVFTHTGTNLSLQERAQDEAFAFRATAPASARQLRTVVLAHHRVRRWLGGIYSQAPFDFSLYTRKAPEHRVTRHVAKPTFRWRW